MYLSSEEKEMLEGKYGYPVQRAMEILVSLGECYDAERMIPVVSAHSVSSLVAFREAGAFFIKELADKGGRFKVFTDTNPLSFDPETWREFAIPADFARMQLGVVADFQRLGAFISNSCTPYLLGNVPRQGQHVAWNETSAVALINSALGARSNREGGPSSLAAALTGRVPEYGLHLDRNRYGNLMIRVTAQLKGPHDYGTLGYFAAKIAQDRVPVFLGIPPAVTCDDFKLMSAAVGTSGSVGLYHIVGVTPEAPTLDVAMGPNRLTEEYEFGEKQLRETEASLCYGTSPEVELVIFGCPHASIEEMRDLARLLDGKRLKSELWVTTSSLVAVYSRQMGFSETIESSGAKIMCQACPIKPSQEFLKGRRQKQVATNCAKLTYYIRQDQEVYPYYGSMEKCVRAAINGRWD